MDEFGFDFSRIGYCGILSDSFAIIWCDNDPLFRRLIRFRDTLKERFFSSNGEISHVFRADGVYYKAVITRLVNNDVMCRIFPATEKTRLASSTIFNNSVDICNDALSIINVSDSLIKDNTVNENISLLSDCAARIYDRGLEVLRYCSLEKGEAYIFIRKYLLDTFYRLNFRVKSQDKRVCPVMDISAQYVKVDYSLFESAILNMIKLFYLAGNNGNCLIAISDNNGAIENELTVCCTFDEGDSFSEDDFKSSGRIIKNLFISMNGVIKMKRDKGKVVINGSVPVKPLRAGRTPEEEEMLFLNREVWEQTTDKPSKLYHHVNGNSFRMNVDTLENIEESDNLSSVLGFLYNKK